MPIETDFDVSFVAKLAAEEKQIQQNYRPIIGVHKWFARRPGSLFRGLLLSEFADGPLSESYLKGNSLAGKTICDPFMGGGTSIFEANRVGCNVIGFDINPMAYWVVRQELAPLDRIAFRHAAEQICDDLDRKIGKFYQTECILCGSHAPVKYFFGVKQVQCGACGEQVDLFPGYLVAENIRHTHFVLHCPGCRELVELKQLPKKGDNATCPKCAVRFDWASGTAARNRYRCPCGHSGKYPEDIRIHGAPTHRLFGLEYHCHQCRPTHKGRFFKTADAADHATFDQAARKLLRLKDLPIPDDEIPDGDETKRLRRWGYNRYREMFNERQLLSLGLLAAAIRTVEESEARFALATVFSDFLRYQNMLCRYDTYALKCQDIFAVHGFPVGLIQCENNVLGIPGIGAGGFRHFIEKYDRAKSYCESPFETLKSPKGQKRIIPTGDERIIGKLVAAPASLNGERGAFLTASSIEDATFTQKVDAVFTDPPYFDNVQYAELMDFCFAWLRTLIDKDVPEFAKATTRSHQELTGNETLGRDLEHFTEGLSRVFTAAASRLRAGGPFAFTYHHNDIDAYAPVIVAILDAGLTCTATLPCPAEMSASLHINGTGSSIVDTIIVCRKQRAGKAAIPCTAVILTRWLRSDRERLEKAEVQVTVGDLLCLGMGHLARAAASRLQAEWDRKRSPADKLAAVREHLSALKTRCQLNQTVDDVLAAVIAKPVTAKQKRLFDLPEPLQAGAVN